MGLPIGPEPFCAAVRVVPDWNKIGTNPKAACSFSWACFGIATILPGLEIPTFGRDLLAALSVQAF